MELFNEIEETFDIRIDDDAVSGLTTVRQMIDFIEAKVALKRGPAGSPISPSTDKADSPQGHDQPH
jgi:hypothetical protein